MILDSIKNTNMYKGVSPYLDEAFRYMKENDLNAMEPGRYPIADGKILVIIKKGVHTKDDEQANWESHRNNIDIQYLLDGEERIGVCPVDLLESKTQYDAESDKSLYYNDNSKGCMITLRKGDYLVLFPDDAHATCLHPGREMTCNKAVIKVALNPE